MVKCPNCKINAQDSDVHCYHCGAKLKSKIAKTTITDISRLSAIGGKIRHFLKTKKWVIFAAILIIIIITASLFFYPRPNITYEVISYPTTLHPHRSAVITVNVANSGRAGGRYSIDLLLNDEVIDSRDDYIKAGESKNLNFVLPSSIPSGQHGISIDGWEREIKKLREAALSIENLSLAPNPVGVGEESIVSATLVNTGEVDGSFHLVVKIGEEVVQMEPVYVRGNLSSPFYTTVIFDEPGTYTVSLNDMVEEQVKVLLPADIKVTGLTLSPSTVETGKAATVSVEVSNSGELEGSHRVTLLVNGKEEQNITVKLEGNSHESVTFEVSKSSSGRYTIASEGYSRTLTVQRPTSQATVSEAPSSGTTTIERPSNGFIIKRSMATDRGSSEFAIVNALNQDVVFVVTSMVNNRPLLVVYVRANDNHTVYNIPDGNYSGFYVTGQNWDSNSNRFTRSASYYKYGEAMKLSSGWIYRMMIVTGSGWQNISSGSFPPL